LTDFPSSVMRVASAAPIRRHRDPPAAAGAVAVLAAITIGGPPTNLDSAQAGARHSEW
jgi:hypothetical protein